MKLKAIVVGMALVIGTSFTISDATAQMAVVDPTNLVQNIYSAVRQAQSNINEAREIAEQIKQYKLMLENSKALLPQEWQDAQQLITELTDVVQQGRGLAYSASDLDQQFRDKFPGYVSDGNLSEKYSEWSQTSLDSIRGALMSAGLQSKGLKTEGQVLADLRNAAKGSTGQKQALDAANELASAHIEQTQKLRQLVMAQMQQEGAYMAVQQQRQAELDAKAHEMTRYNDPREGLQK